MNRINESAVNIITEGTRIDGNITLDSISRVHGILAGKVKAKEGSVIILCENGLVEGDVDADSIVVDGCVRGDIRANKRVVVSRTGRVFGNIQTPSLVLEFGAYFEGRCEMENLVPRPA